MVFPPLFILFCMIVIVAVCFAEFGLFRLLGWAKKCSICRRWSMSEDFRQSYNELCKLLSINEQTMGFVCKSCDAKMKSAAAGKFRCENCNRALLSEVLHIETMDSIKRATSEMKSEVKSFCDLLGQPQRMPNNLELLCTDCRRTIKDSTIQGVVHDFLTSIGSKAKQPVLLHRNVASSEMHCARCGIAVSKEENCVEQLRFLYSDDAYSYPDYKGECKSVIAPYLGASSLCKSCCWQLRPEHVRADYLHRSGDGWIGGVKGDAIPGYRIMHQFDVVAHSEDGCETIDELKEKLRDKSLRVGANGFINFWYNRHSRSCYTGRAIPATFVQTGHSTRDNVPSSVGSVSAKTSVTTPTKIVIDGSNMIRANGSSSVGGLLACLFALKKAGYHAQVFFDANVLHVLNDIGDTDGRVQLERLMKDFPGRVQMVPAGSRADDFILQRVDVDGCHILSNDRFEPYAERYPWLKEHRLHKFMFMDGRLMIPDFGIDVEV